MHSVAFSARRDGGRPSSAGRLDEEAGQWRQCKNPGEVNPLYIPKTFKKKIRDVSFDWF